MSEIATEGRVLECTACGEDVLVYELPREWLEPTRYRCGLCQKNPERRAQLELVQRRREPEVRDDYDPAQAAIPF